MHRSEQNVRISSLVHTSAGKTFKLSNQSTHLDWLETTSLFTKSHFKACYANLKKSLINTSEAFPVALWSMACLLNCSLRRVTDHPKEWVKTHICITHFNLYRHFFKVNYKTKIALADIKKRR